MKCLKVNKKKTKMSDMTYNLSKGLVLWTRGNADTFGIESSGNDITINTGSSGSNTKILTITSLPNNSGDTATLPKVYNVEFDSTDKTEKYSGQKIEVGEASADKTLISGTALMIVPENSNNLVIASSGQYSTNLRITSAASMNFKAPSSKIEIKNGGLLVLGGCNTTLSSNGLKNGEVDDTCKYSTISGNSNASGGTGSIVIASGKTLTIESGSTLHIGSYRFGNGTLTVNENLTLSGNTSLNIGAANVANTNNTVTVSGTTIITDSVINVGGAGGVGCEAAGGCVGGVGTLNVASKIINSNIFVGSGGGASGSGVGGNGGSGTLTVTSKISNSNIFIGGAGGGGAAGAGGNGGSGTLTVTSEISNSVVFVGSSGGGGSAGDIGPGGDGGGAGGTLFNSGGKGGNCSLTTSGSTNKITNKIVSFGLPAASGGDITQSIQTGPISNSVVFVGSGNYGNNGNSGAGGGNGAYGGGGAGGAGGAGNGASVALDGKKHGYLSQRMIMSFRGMTPGILTLPDGTQFQYIGEFPRADCSSWATSSETVVDVNAFIPSITDNRNNLIYNSPPCFLEPTDNFIPSSQNFNAIIINPKKDISSTSFGLAAKDCVRISDEFVEVIDKKINDGTEANNVKGRFIGMFNANSLPSNIYYSTLDLTGFKVDSSKTPSATESIKIITKPSSTALFTSDCKIDFLGTLVDETSGQTLSFNRCEFVGTPKVSKAINLDATYCKFDSGTTIENDKPTTLYGSGREPMNLTNLNIKDLSHDIELTNCSIGLGTTITRTSGKTTHNGEIYLINTTLADNKKLVFGNIIDTYNNIFTMSGSTMNADVTIKDIITSGTSLVIPETINNCVFNAPTTVSGNTYTMTSLTFNKRSIRNHSSNNAFEKNVKVTVSGTEFELSGINVDSGAIVNTNYKFGVTSAATDSNSAYHITGTYDVNLKGQLKTSDGINWRDGSNAPTLTIGNGQSTLDNGFDATKNCLLTFTGDTNNISVGEGVKFDFNDAIKNLTISNDSGMTKIYSRMDFNNFVIKFIQDNIIISSLDYYQFNASLTYDKTTSFICPSMKLYTSGNSALQITIANDSITNNSSNGNPLTITNSFQIGNTQVICSEASPFIVSPNATVQFIGTGIYEADGVALSDTTIIDGDKLEFSNNYIKLVCEDSTRKFEGVTLKINGKNLVLDGSLTINQTTYLLIDSDITIPNGTSLALSSTTSENYVKISGTVAFIGVNNITFNIASGTTSSGPHLIEFTTPTNASAQRDISIVSGSTFIESTVTFNSFSNTGECEFNNASGHFSFINTKLFKFVHSKISDDKILEITNNGIVGWYNAEINPIDNGQMTISNGSSICPLISASDSSPMKRVLTFNGTLNVGTLNISPKGSLTITGDSGMSNVFLGTLQINNDVHFAGFVDSDGTVYSPLSSDKVATTLIVNTSKYDAGNPFRGQLVMNVQSGCTATLQINSLGRISIDPKSKFIVSGYNSSQKVVINGTFKSSVEGATYEYQKDMTLNGTIEMEHSAIIRGNLQITSSGKLLLGSIATSTEKPDKNDVLGVTPEIIYGKDTTTQIGIKYTITFKDGVNYANTIITDITVGATSGVTASYEGTGISPLRNVTKDDSDSSKVKYSWEYSNGLLATLTDDGMDNPITFSAPSGMTIGNVFFGDSSDVYISDTLNIFGTFYNNGKLTVNARLTCAAGSSIFNDGEIAVKGGNDNTIIGTVEIGNLAHLIFNGTYRDHREHRLVINERGILTVNDSFTLSTITKEMIISALVDPQKCNVLINGDIVTIAARYHIKPDRDDKRESVYIPINIQADLLRYVVNDSA